MCILKVYSDTDSFKSFEETTRMPVYSRHEKGEKQRTDHRISFTVSDRSWDDIKAQIDDAFLFLKEHFDELDQLMKSHNVSTAYLDFPVYSRLNNDIVNQNDHFPKELISIAGKLSLGIEIAIYSKNAFDDSEE